MKTKRRKLGFTMAEMLIVVAIIAVLGGVSFVAVQRYQRSMAQLEYDAVAKEIFVAAQNHLTVVEGQDFLNLKETEGQKPFGAAEEGSSGIYYFVFNKGDSFGGNTLLDYMLPFGSVDETVRAGGNYIVRYQKQPAAVLDVFYSASSGGRFSHAFSAGEYSTILNLSDTYSGKNNRSDRGDYGGKVIGWYGGKADQETVSIEELNPPIIEVENAEQLRVKITDTNYRTDNTLSLKLIIEGKSSGAKAAFALNGTNLSSRLATEVGGAYTLVLDDVTHADWHFNQLNTDTDFEREGSKTFYPGEDITISAVACGKTVLTNIAYSGEMTTNSLFAGVEDGTVEDTTSAVRTAQISNFRHLENLSGAISALDTDAHEDLNIAAAAQLENLDWPAFDTAMGGTGKAVSVYDKDNKSTDAHCYMPVTPGYALAYDGQGHWIDGVKAQGSGDAGLFGSTTDGSKIANLALVNFDISATGSAGALAGTLNNTAVTNVVAYSGSAPAAASPAPADGSTPEPAGGTTPAPTADGGASAAEGRIVSSGGNAGGLVGTMNGGSMARSAAALYVGGKDAGGLVGSASEGASFTACYSGGHTKDGKYEDAEGAEPKYSANVSATGVAGGLIGSMTDGAAAGCYSTCSVSGATAGGMAGAASGKFTSCYATGRVTGTAAAGAFAGTLSGTAADCLYIEIINERIGQGADEGKVSYLSAVSGAEATAGIAAADADAYAYNEFMGDPSGWAEAKPYDLPTLEDYYSIEGEKRYPLESLERLNADTLQDGDFVNIHYGDWPVPETFVEND